MELAGALCVLAALVQPLGGVLRVDPELVGEHLDGRRGRRETEHRTGAMLALPHREQPGHRGARAGPGRSDEHVERPSTGGDLLHRERLVDAERTVAAGEVLARHARDGCERNGRGVRAPSRLKQPLLGIQQALGCVEQEQVVGRAQKRGSIGPAVALRDVMKLRRRDHQRAAGRELRGRLGDRQAVLIGREAHAAQLAVNLREHVRAREGGAALRRALARELRELGEHLDAQIAGAQRREIAAVVECRHPRGTVSDIRRSSVLAGAALVPHVPTGPVAATSVTVICVEASTSVPLTIAVTVNCPLLSNRSVLLLIESVSPTAITPYWLGSSVHSFPYLSCAVTANVTAESTGTERFKSSVANAIDIGAP